MSSTHTLAVWWDDPADGCTNMAADEVLAAESDRRGMPLVRIYGWSQASVSLGGFQAVAEAAGIDAIRGLPLVRRPSGGGAIVHGSDLTYAAAVPRHHPWGRTPQVLYDALHGAMIEALAGFGIAALAHDAAAGRRDDGPGADAARFFCFDRRAIGDLVMPATATAPGGKIMGIAQRRLAGVVLQHGSLLLRSNRLAGTAARHAGLAELVDGGHPVPDPVELSRAWCRRIAAAAAMTLHEEPAPFLRGRDHEVAAVAARFRDPRWTARR